MPRELESMVITHFGKIRSELKSFAGNCRWQDRFVPGRHHLRVFRTAVAHYSHSAMTMIRAVRRMDHLPSIQHHEVSRASMCFLPFLSVVPSTFSAMQYSLGRLADSFFVQVRLDRAFVLRQFG
jgi:hypothetical protein